MKNTNGQLQCIVGTPAVVISQSIRISVGGLVFSPSLTRRTREMFTASDTHDSAWSSVENVAVNHNLSSPYVSTVNGMIVCCYNDLKS